MSKNQRKDFFKMAKQHLTDEQLGKAHIKAKKEILNIQLSKLREMMGVRQTDIKNFTQSSVSKIEARRDIKLSTLLEYLEALHVGVEIIVQPRKPKSKPIVLLKR